MPNDKDFDLPKWWGITDLDDEEDHWAQGDTGNASHEDRNLFCFEVDDTAEDAFFKSMWQ